MNRAQSQTASVPPVEACFAWSPAQPAARTNWLIINWCLSSSMFAAVLFSLSFFFLC
uniref:Uncharacterized protein n=1 Tax=Anguilla anguilla TaxID=7936 RepID=A0A0E9UPW0_ANGAN